MDLPAPLRVEFVVASVREVASALASFRIALSRLLGIAGEVTGRSPELPPNFCPR
jgi:hypothetical protein